MTSKSSLPRGSNLDWGFCLPIILAAMMLVASGEVIVAQPLGPPPPALNPSLPPAQPQRPPRITSVVPSLGEVGEHVRIGVTFPVGVDKSRYAVLFNRRSAPVIDLLSGFLVVEVPQGLDPGPVIITVIEEGLILTSEKGFEVERQSTIWPLWILGVLSFLSVVALATAIVLKIQRRLEQEKDELRRINALEREEWQREKETQLGPHISEVFDSTSSKDLATATTATSRHAPIPVVTPDLPDALVTACSEGQCVLFVGAGVGVEAGYPTWGEALGHLIDWAAANDNSDRWSEVRRALDAGQLLLVAELLATRCERSVLVDELRKLYAARGGDLPRVWRALASVPFGNVLTSTWDPLVDRAFAKHKEGLSVVVTPWSTKELPQLLSEQAFCIARLWGDLMTRRIIFTDDEYRNALKENPLWARYLTTLAISRPHFFVGTSLATIEHYITNVSTRDQSVRHYALVPDGEGMQLQRERFGRYGVELILFAPTTGWPEVTAAAEALRAAVVRHQSEGPKYVLEPVTLSEVTLRNIGPFDEFSLKFRPGWNVLLGNNGLGKSTLLKAIALGLCGDDVNAAVHGGRLLRQKGAQDKEFIDKGFIQLQVGRDTYRTDIANEAGSIRVSCDQVTPLQHGRWLVLGFPPLRGISTQDPTSMTQGGSPTPTVHDLLPLLAGPTDIRLNDLKQWLVNLNGHSSFSENVTHDEAARNKRLLNKFFEVLGQFTTGVSVAFDGVIGGKVMVKTEDGIVSIDQLSQGVGSIIGWVGTLLQRMYEIHSDSVEPEKGAAIVLIDEIDAHLHPKWQQILVDVVKDVFPATQFIVTTHSPLIVAGLTREEVMIFSRDSCDAQRPISVERPPGDLKGWRVDQILTGEAFGLGGARDLETVANLDRYTDLMGQYPRSEEEEQQLRMLAVKLGTDLPPPESQARARKAYEIIASAVDDKLGSMPEEERSRLNAEIKSQVQEIVSGERRPS